MMDFDCGDWDVTGEATQLVNNLFKKKKAKKRKAAAKAKEANCQKKFVEPPNLQNMSVEDTKLTKGGSENASSKKSKKKKKHIPESSDLNFGQDSAKAQNKPNKTDKVQIIHVHETNTSQQSGQFTFINGVKSRTDSPDVKDSCSKPTTAKKRKMDDGCVVSSDTVKRAKSVESNPDEISANTCKKKKRKRKCKKNKFKDYSNENDLQGKQNNPDLVSSSLNEYQTSTVLRKEMTLSNDHVKDTKCKQSKKEKKKARRKKVKHLSKETAKSKFDAVKLGAILATSKIDRNNDVTKEVDRKSIDTDTKPVLETNSAAFAKSDGKSLLEKSRERLNAARFRYLNEQLYSSTGQDAYKLFKQDKDAFDVYHTGFQSQVEKWPTNPVDVIIGIIKTKPKRLVVADFGCGDAKIAQNVANKVHSFDLVALNDRVTVCDIAKVPLGPASVDIGVFCLSLMGTNLTTYLMEAHRVIKTGGTMYVAEVTSRFPNIGQFVLQVEKIGFKCLSQDSGNKMFVLMTFRKTGEPKVKDSESIQLKPCVYKKR